MLGLKISVRVQTFRRSPTCLRTTSATLTQDNFRAAFFKVSVQGLRAGGARRMQKLNQQVLKIESPSDVAFVKCFIPVRFQKNLIPPEKKRTNWDMFNKQQKMDGGCLTHLFWTSCQLCNYLLKYKTIPVILWKLYNEIRKFPRKGNFWLILENFTRARKYFTQMPFVTNSTSDLL